MEFVDAALRFGEIFGEEERAEFAATFVRGYVASPGVLRMYPTGSAREARGVPPTFGWARLARQDESLKQAIMPVLRNLHDEGAEVVGNYPHTAGDLPAAATALAGPPERVREEPK